MDEICLDHLLLAGQEISIGLIKQLSAIAREILSWEHY